MSSESRSRIIGRISKIMRFSFREGDLPPELRKEIGEVAERLDYYNHVAFIRDRAKATSTNRFLYFVFLIILGLITFVFLIVSRSAILFIFGMIFFALAYLPYMSYKKNKATARSKQIEALSWWSDINSRVEKLANKTYSELSALHEARVRPTVKHITVDFARIIQAARGKGIILTSIECPHCNGEVKIPQTGEYFQCQYCGKTIHATKIFDKLKDILTPTE